MKAAFSSCKCFRRGRSSVIVPNPVRHYNGIYIGDKILKIRNGNCPQPYDPPRKLRSVDKPAPLTAALSPANLFDCAFCCAAPVLWSNVPQDMETAKTVDSFEVNLKTYFYSVSFA